MAQPNSRPGAAHQLGGKQDRGGNQQRADRIDVAHGIEADAAGLVGRRVAEHARHVAVRGLVQRDREDHGNRVDRDELDDFIHSDAL
ncbi:Uncharacterised protein [Bordetella pertussis]|nr:Uncharacterised protein [Bordetella pertussis]